MKQVYVNDIIFLENLLTRDGFLNFIKTNSGVIKNTYQNLNKELKCLKDIYEKILFKKTLNLDINKFYFTCSYTYNIYKGNINFINAFYNIIWNTEKINEVVDKYNLKPEILDLECMYSTMTYDATKKINKTHLPVSLLNKEAICVIDFEPLCTKGFLTLPNAYKNFMILDGNHRVYSRINYNEKKSLNPFRKKYTTINAIKLTPEQHMQIMTHPDIKTLYMINSNLNFLRKYIIGEFTLKQLNFSYYKI